MLSVLHILALVPNWMDPDWLLDRFGQELLWISLIIVFVECGLLFPILPGDALLFSLGLFIKRAESGESGIDTNIWVACILLSAAAFAGNVVGYEIGRAVGPRLAESNNRFLKPKYFAQTHLFFEQYGNRALVMGRFVPIVRTFVTVVAGIGEMNRNRFLTWSFVGAVLWATGLTLLGYLAGNVDFLQKNIEAAILAIVFVSAAPMLYEFQRHRRLARAAAAPVEEPRQ